MYYLLFNVHYASFIMHDCTHELHLKQYKKHIASSY